MNTKKDFAKESIRPAVENIGKQRSPEQEFVDAYNELCEKHGFTLSPTPTWVQSKDNGDWRVVVQFSIVKIERQKD